MIAFAGIGHSAVPVAAVAGFAAGLVTPPLLTSIIGAAAAIA